MGESEVLSLFALIVRTDCYLSGASFVCYLYLLSERATLALDSAPPAYLNGFSVRNTSRPGLDSLCSFIFNCSTLLPMSLVIEDGGSSLGRKLILCKKKWECFYSWTCVQVSVRSVIIALMVGFLLSFQRSKLLWHQSARLQIRRPWSSKGKGRLRSFPMGKRRTFMWLGETIKGLLLTNRWLVSWVIIHCVCLFLLEWLMDLIFICFMFFPATNGVEKPAQLSLQFRVFLVSAQSGTHTKEQRTLNFWFGDSLSAETRPTVAQEFFRELVSPQEFPRGKLLRCLIYFGYITLITKKILIIKKILFYRLCRIY